MVHAHFPADPKLAILGWQKQYRLLHGVTWNIETPSIFCRSPRVDDLEQ